MKVAVIGSRTLSVHDLSPFLPSETTEIVSGGACGIDTCARAHARTHGLRLTEFFPDYRNHGKNAPLVRNKAIITYSDLIVAFWDGHSTGTQHVIKQCRAQQKPVRVYMRK